MKYLFIFIYCFIVSIFALPIEQQAKDNKTFHVNVDRLSQIITTHLQFDHFDSVISNTDNMIAKEFQHHIQINIQWEGEEETILTSHGSNQHTIQEHLPTLDMMDLEILKSQIFAAIQAHTEGNLPLVWDKLADNLSKQKLETYVRQLLLDTCPTSVTMETITSDCLEENASYLANQLDSYIQSSLEHVFTLLDNDILPNLLQHTADDLKGILNYFNSAFLDGNRKFVLKAIPWSTNVHGFKSKLLELAVHPPLSNDNTELNHSVAFFIEYASMAKL